MSRVGLTGDWTVPCADERDVRERMAELAAAYGQTLEVNRVPLDNERVTLKVVASARDL